MSVCLLYIRRQLIALHAELHLRSSTLSAHRKRQAKERIRNTHLVRTRLQKLPRLQPSPHLQQRDIPLLDTLPQRLAPALTAQLPQNRQRALEEIEVRIQTSADTLEQQDADHDVHEVAFHAHVVRAHHAQHLGEHVPDPDVAERKGLALDAEDEVLHAQGEDLGVDDGVGLAAALDHEVPGAVAVELGDGLEEVEEVGAVGLVEGGDEAGVDEDELGAVALLLDLMELLRPGFGVVAVGAELREDFLGDVFGVGGRVGLLVPAEGEIESFGLVEADHDVSGVEVGVNEVVDEEHVQEGVEAFIGDFLLEDSAAVFEEGGEGNALRKFFDEDLPRAVFAVGVGEPSGCAIFKILAEHYQVGGFDAHVKLEAHHLAELADFVGKGEPFDGWNGIQDIGKEGHYAEVTADEAFDLGVKDFDGYI